MAQPDDIEARMAAQEARTDDLSKEVRRSREDAAAVRLLAGGADRDVAGLREEMRDFRKATTASSNAMREDLIDLRQQVGGLDKRVGSLEKKVDYGFAEMRGKFDVAAAGHEQVVNMLTTIIERDK